MDMSHKIGVDGIEEKPWEEVVVEVGVKDLFSDEVVELLRRGFTADEIMDIPEDVSRELDVIAENFCNKLFKKVREEHGEVEVSEGFKRMLKEWVKMLFYKIYVAIEKASKT